MRNADLTDQNAPSSSRYPRDEGLDGHARVKHTSRPYRATIMGRVTKGDDVTMRGLLTIKEAAAWFAISPATCYRLMERGTLRSLKIGGARRVRLSDLQALIAHEI
jgi:excisionase family DNA binding protein